MQRERGERPMVNRSGGLAERELDRRAFLGLMGTAAAGFALAGRPGGLVLVDAAEAAELSRAVAAERWISAACWHNCGGRCVNKVLVRGDVVVRQKTDDTHLDDADFPQQRACLRGWAQRKQVFGADRLKYPMKRKHWAPGGGRKDLRGRDEWERISWDEALDIVAGEIRRIRNEHGSRSIFLTGGGDAGRVLAVDGGYVSRWGTESWGTWYYGGDAVGLGDGWTNISINDRLDLRNSQLVVLWGCNPAWGSMGNPTYNFLQARKAGARFIFVDPHYSESAQVLADEWIPIRPTTDHAMLLGMAHTLITEDDPESNPLIDWDFLNRCTVGFDAEHMPEGVDPAENFRDYVLGVRDGVAKTAEWAAEICGVDAERIRRLAREIGGTSRVALLTGWAPARVRNRDSWPQMFMTLGAMTGHIGESGRMTGVSAHRAAGNGGPFMVRSGGGGLPGVRNPVGERINDNEIWTAVLEGRYTAGRRDVRELDIRLIYHGGAAVLQTRDGMTRGIEAHRKVDFVVSQSQFLTTNSRYADVVLPVTTAWERPGGTLPGNREILISYSQVTEPLFEAKDDEWIAAELAKRLGHDAEQLYPTTQEQRLFNQLAGARVMREGGPPNSRTGFEPLLSISAEDIAARGVQGRPQQGRIPLAEFEERGIYQVKRSPGDNFGFISHKEYREDPEANRLRTPSGKLEIHSAAWAARVARFGWEEIAPIPAYVPAVEGYEHTFSDWDRKIKGEFPLQLYNPHYPRRSHTVFDNVPWMREAFPDVLFMSPDDAAARGIRQGDTVLITSPHGRSLRPVQLTQRMMPGVVALPHGAWVEIDEATGIDRAGADNILCGAIPTGQGTSGWNSCIVQVAKWDGEPLPPDHEWPQRVIN